jgi:hypothetical protein
MDSAIKVNRDARTTTIVGWLNDHKALAMREHGPAHAIQDSVTFM